MRHLIKSIILAIATVYITYTLIPTLQFGADLENLLFFIGGIWLISQIINPIFTLVLLPLNIITFGLVSFVFHIALVYALLYFLPGFQISAYNFPGANYEGIVFPAVDLNLASTIVLIALFITILQKAFHIIFE